MQLYTDYIGDIEIYSRSESLEMIQIKVLHFPFASVNFISGMWQILMVRLPDIEALQQIIIRGVRPANAASAMKLDDITIQPCSELSKFIDFLTNCAPFVFGAKT